MWLIFRLAVCCSGSGLSKPVGSTRFHFMFNSCWYYRCLSSLIQAASKRAKSCILLHLTWIVNGISTPANTYTPYNICELESESAALSSKRFVWKSLSMEDSFCITRIPTSWFWADAAKQQWIDRGKLLLEMVIGGLMAKGAVFTFITPSIFTPAKKFPPGFPSEFPSFTMKSEAR